MYLIFDTETQARNFSHAAAVSRGLGGEDDVCQYWYQWRETIDGRWAVQCPEGNEPEPQWKPQEVEDEL